MSILAEILATKRGEVDAAKRARPRSALEAACLDVGPTRGFADALARPPGAPLRVIGEVKRASPSAGPIRPDADPAEIARDYQRGGATCLSILTDERYFDGQLAFLGAARAAVRLPLLRKDFLIDPYQVLEARAAGADAVLLIVAAVADSLLGELLSAARELGLDALVEAHCEEDAARAVSAGARLIGVNHRDLATFHIDMSLTGRLRAYVPEGTVLVGESGIKSAADARALADAGADAILVGESLMRAPSPGDALAAMLGAQ